MHMIKKITLAWMLVIASLVTTAAMAATQTYEVSILSLRLPVSESGTMTLRECDDCDYHSVRVTPLTQYWIDDETLRLDDFRKRILYLKSRGDITVNVTRDDETNTVVNAYVYTQ